MAETACFCCAENCDLNKREARYFKKFTSNMISDYVGTNPVHESNLEKLFNLAYGCSPASDENVEKLSMIDERWKDMGFQQKNPRTDFRGGGHLSLLCLIYFAENYPNEFQEMIGVTKDREDLMWLTAISSINMTHALIIYLYMNSGHVSPNFEKFRAGRVQFKKFCKLNSLNKRSFFIIQCFGVRYLYHSWLKKVNEIGVGKIPELMVHFSTLVEGAKAAISELLAERTLDVEKLVRRTEERIQVLRDGGGQLQNA